MNYTMTEHTVTDYLGLKSEFILIKFESMEEALSMLIYLNRMGPSVHRFNGGPDDTLMINPIFREWVEKLLNSEIVRIEPFRPVAW